MRFVDGRAQNRRENGAPKRPKKTRAFSRGLPGNYNIGSDFLVGDRPLENISIEHNYSNGVIRFERMGGGASHRGPNMTRPPTPCPERSQRVVRRWWPSATHCHRDGRRSTKTGIFGIEGAGNFVRMKCKICAHFPSAQPAQCDFTIVSL